MESILTAAVTDILTLIGELISNTKSRAVMKLKVDQLREQVERCGQWKTRRECSVMGSIIGWHCEDCRAGDSTAPLA